MFLLREAAWAASTKSLRSQGLPFLVLPESRLPALSLFPGHRPAKARQVGSGWKARHLDPDLGQDTFCAAHIPPSNGVEQVYCSFPGKRLSVLLEALLGLEIVRHFHRGLLCIFRLRFHLRRRIKTLGAFLAHAFDRFL